MMTPIPQSSITSGVSTYQKLIKLKLNKQEKNHGNTKKVFSRKPLNISQNSSRLLSNRLKTQEDEEDAKENQQQKKTLVCDLLKKTKNIKFVSTKSSKSLQKLFESPSVQQLPMWKVLASEQGISGSQTFNKNHSKNNNLIKPPKFTDNNTLDSNLEIIRDFEKEDFDSKENVGSTELSSSYNICNSDLNEDEFGNMQLNKSKRNYTSSFCFSNDRKYTMRECPNCLVNSQKVKDLTQQNKKLQTIFQAKDEEIKKLTLIIQKMSRNLKQTQSRKINFEHQLKIMREKQILLSSQKEEVQAVYKKLQMSFSKISQQMKYKDLQINISKIYKTKSHEMEMKVENLKNQLNRMKSNANKMMQSRSSGNLREMFTSPVPRRMDKYQRHNSNKNLKQPKIVKVYSEDSVFSLSQEECD